jgi:hypothetical protein
MGVGNLMMIRHRFKAPNLVTAIAPKDFPEPADREG